MLNVFAQEHADCMDVFILLSMSIQGQVDSLCRSSPAQKIRAESSSNGSDLRSAGFTPQKKIRAELSSNVSSRPAESSSNGSCRVSLAQKMRKFRDAGDFSLRDGDSLDSFHVRWIRCRRPVSLRLCLRLHFCRRLRAVSTCSRADGRVSRPRLTSCFAIVSSTS